MANFQQISPIKLGQAEATISYTTLYDVSSNARVIIKTITICNTTTESLNLFISLVPALGTADSTNAIYYGFPIAAHTTLQWTGTQILNAGESVQIKGSAVGLTITASGGEAA